MSLKKVAKSLAVAFLAAILLAAGAIYLLSSSVPSHYQPAQLSHRQRNEAAKHFYGKVMDFDGQVQAAEPFDLSLTQEELNNYLASLDEIAALLPDGQSGKVEGLMDAAGLADPAIALGDGVATLMVRSTRHDNRIVSADVAFRFAPDNRLRMRLGQMRIGRLAVPQDLVRRRLERLREALAGSGSHRAGKERAGNWAESAALVEVVAEAATRAITAAIDGEAIVPEGVWHRWRLRVEGIEIAPQKLTLRLRPLGNQKDHAAR